MNNLVRTLAVLVFSVSMLFSCRGTAADKEAAAAAPAGETEGKGDGKNDTAGETEDDAFLKECLKNKGKALAAKDADRLLEIIKKKNGALKSFTADYTQVKDVMQVEKIETKGTLKVKKPDKILAADKDTKIYISGKTMWIYCPKDKRADKYRLADEVEADAEAAIFRLAVTMDIDELKKTFTYTVTPRKDRVEIALTYKDKKVARRYESIVARLDAKTLYPVGAEIKWIDGDTVTLTMKITEKNPKLKDSEFTFTPPKGVKVVKH